MSLGSVILNVPVDARYFPSGGMPVDADEVAMVVELKISSARTHLRRHMPSI